MDAILDAAAELLAAKGVEGVTMHGVAKRARTAIGSMYHFFTDREALLVALAARHARAVRALIEDLEREAVDWARLSAEESVERALGPLLAYIERHPDVLPMVRAMSTGARAAAGETELTALMIQAAEHVLAARSPGLPPSERTARAATMVAVLEGAVSMMARPGLPPRDALTRELRRVLVAYLDAGLTGSRARRAGRR